MSTLPPPPPDRREYRSERIAPAVSAHIHARGDSRLDAVMDLVAFASRPRPLATALDEIPRRIAAVFSSAVCSLYLLEGHDLVMRGNVGFATDALGEVRLSVGEGLTGMAVEVMRPVTADVAHAHARYRHFPTLGEERYPAFLAVPVPGPQGAAGAVVVQRESPAYTPSEVELLAALVGALTTVVDRARIVDGLSRPPPASTGVGTRRVTLPGRALVPGRALGQVVALRRPSPRAARDPVRSPRESARVLEKALSLCDDSLEMYARAATRQGLDGGFLAMYRTMLADERLRERALELSGTKGLVHALGQVAREATRAARMVADPTQDERAAEMSELCDALRELVAPEGGTVQPHRQAVWVGDGFTVFDLLMAVRSRPCALVLAGPVTNSRPRVLVELLEVPAVAEVTGLFHWASDGDVALVDGDHGLVRINPTRRERDEARLERQVERPVERQE